MNTNSLTSDHLTAFRTANGFLITPIKNIVCCEADGNYAQLTLVGETPTMITHKLKDVLEKLPETFFIRTHKSHAINVLHVKKAINNGCLTLCMTNGKKLKVAHRRRPELLSLLENMVNENA